MTGIPSAGRSLRDRGRHRSPRFARVPSIVTIEFDYLKNYFKFLISVFIFGFYALNFIGNHLIYLIVISNSTLPLFNNAFLHFFKLGFPAKITASNPTACLFTPQCLLSLTHASTSNLFGLESDYLKNY